MSQPDQLDPSSIQWLVRSAALLTQYRAITGNLQAASRVEAGNVQLVAVVYSGDSTTVQPLSAWIPAAKWIEYMQTLVSVKKPILEDAVLYICDDAMVLCWKHCGHTARMTGRDLSGLPVEVIDEEMQRIVIQDHGWPLTCEVCRDEVEIAQ